MWQNHYSILKQKRLFVSAGARMMSSEGEEEGENGQRFFVSHKPNFKSKRFEKLIKIIDDAYMGKSSRRSLEQMRRREIGEPSNLLAPTLKFVSHYVVV